MKWQVIKDMVLKRNKLTSKQIGNLIFIFLLLIITISIFQYTVKIRRPWFGTISAEKHQYLSGSSLVWSKNWYREGPLSLKYGLIWNPKSIEFPTLLSRTPHASYPPGRVLPIYIISKIRKHEPTPSLLMKYNLLNHFFIAFFLSLTIYFFLLQLNFNYMNAFILSIIPILLELLLPAPLYWHQNVYGSDQAVLLPFVLFIFFEVIRRSINNKRMSKSINYLQILVLFYGTLTDWLFIFVALTVYMKRILIGEMGKNTYSVMKTSIKYWSPSILALSLFTFQLHSLGVLPRIIYKFLFRTGLGAGGDKYTINFYNKFWEGHITEAYGGIANWLLWGSLFMFVLSIIYIGFQHYKKIRINDKIKDILSLVGILLIPCFMQVYFLKNHSWCHNFSALKFSIPLATVPFILIPILLYTFFKIDIQKLFLVLGKLKIHNRDWEKEMKLPIILCIIILVGIYLKNEHPRFKDIFPEPNRDFEKIGKFIKNNTSYKDIVFSKNYEIPEEPPQQLSFSMKRVYKVETALNIYNKVKNIDEDYRINIFMIGKNIINNDIKELISISYDLKEKDDLYLYKIKKEEFIEKYQEIIRDFTILINKEILVSNNVFDLYEIKNNYDFIKDIAPPVYESLNKRYNTLLSRYGTEDIISKKVSFVEYHYKSLDDNNYRFYFLFKVNSGFNKDWRIYFHGHVRDDDVNLLPEGRRRYKCDNWDFDPNPQTSDWPKGKYIMITKEILAKKISYNMNIGFYRIKEGRHGKQIKLGWINLGTEEMEEM